MDSFHFDNLARSLATTIPRRRIVLRLAGGVVGGALSRLGQPAAAAACGMLGDRCRRDADCCDDSTRCRNGRCRCVRGLTACGPHYCTDLKNSFGDCGRCGHRCGDGEQCIDGACRDVLGSACATSRDCGHSGFIDCDVVSSADGKGGLVGCGPASIRRCCVFQNNDCRADCDCCGSMVCRPRAGEDAGVGCCSPRGTPCTSDRFSLCCSGVCDAAPGLGAGFCA